MSALKTINATPLPTRVWIEQQGGTHIVVMQHDGFPAFDYATFCYDYRYTDNASIKEDAETFAVRMGATVPVLVKQRDYDLFGDLYEGAP